MVKLTEAEKKYAAWLAKNVDGREFTVDVGDLWDLLENVGVSEEVCGGCPLKKECERKGDADVPCFKVEEDLNLRFRVHCQLEGEEPTVQKTAFKVRIKRVYRDVPYEIEADLHEIKSVDQVGQLMRQAEQFIDKIIQEDGWTKR